MNAQKILSQLKRTSNPSAITRLNRQLKATKKYRGNHSKNDRRQLVLRGIR